MLKLAVGQDTWKFDSEGVKLSPELPLRITGIATNYKFPKPHLMYAVDALNGFWIGNVENDMTLTCTDPEFVLDLIYDFNILDWARVCEAVGSSYVQRIIDHEYDVNDPEDDFYEGEEYLGDESFDQEGWGYI